MSSRASTITLKVGDVVVMQGAMGGPAMLVTGFGYANAGTCQGATALLESLQRHEKDNTLAAWSAEFLTDGLRVLPEGHPARTSPFYEFGVAGRDVPESA
jgi:hypothetical protein